MACITAVGGLQSCKPASILLVLQAARVDAHHHCGAHASSDGASGSPKLLVQLAKSALRTPGLSINVAVAVPQTEYDEEAREVMAELLADVNRPAVNAAELGRGMSFGQLTPAPAAAGSAMSLQPFICDGL